MAAIELEVIPGPDEPIRVFPYSRQEGPAVHVVPLSIIDATTANYGPCAAIWFFDNLEATNRPLTPPDSDLTTVFASQLRQSLSRTLSDFPHFAGHLKFVTYDPEGDHTKRYGRVQVTYGSDTDPGVHFTLARCNLRLDNFLPHPDQRRTKAGRFWDLSDVPTLKFIPSTPTPALKEQDPNVIAPAMFIQVTEFSCGGISIGVSLCHALADAHTLALFMHRWNYEHLHLLPVEEKTAANMAAAELAPLPILDPLMLDSRADGDVNAAEPDPAILEKARRLPTFRYDWFATIDGQEAELPPGFIRDMIKSPGDIMPWSDWDPRVPPAHCKLFFSGEEVQRIWEAANTPEAPVSRHDAILAHVWQALNRARGLAEDDESVYLNIFFGLRRRLDLPEEFVGSPISTTNVAFSGREAATLPLSTIAGQIKRQLNLYDREALAARLHDAIFECCPQRLWDGFLGRRNVIATSWARLNLYAVDFGGARGTARYIEDILPTFDGLLQVMEARPVREVGNMEGADGADPMKGVRTKRHWCDDGVDVSIFLGKEAKERLRGDEGLWKYA